MTYAGKPEIEVEKSRYKRAGHKAWIAFRKGIITRRTNGG